MSPTNPLRLLVRAAFEGHDLTLIEYRGAPAFLVSEIGQALGYAVNSLASRISGRWAAEFRDGDHYHLLTGAELAALKELLTDSVSSRTPNLLLLTESGLYRVLMLTGKPVGVRMRDWLDSEVLPSIARSGSYGRGLPGPGDELRQVVREEVRAALGEVLGARDPDAEPGEEVDLDRLGSEVQRARELRHLAGRYRRVKQPGVAARLEARAASLLLGEPELTTELAPVVGEEDPWTEPIRKWLAGINHPFKAVDVLSDAMFMEPSRQDRAAIHHAARVLRSLGYESKVIWDSGHSRCTRWWRARVA